MNAGNLQVTAITGRLAWGRDGRPWAFRRIDGLPYMPGTQHDTIAALHAALSGVHGDWAAWGLCEPISRDELAATIAAGSRHRLWHTATVNTIRQIEPTVVHFRRAFYLAFPVDGVNHRPGGDGRAAVPPARKVQRALNMAAQYERALARLPGRPATAAEIAWIVERVVTRGSVDLPVDLHGDVLAGQRLADLADCWISNGAREPVNPHPDIQAIVDADADPADQIQAIRQVLDDTPHTPRFSRWARVEGPHGVGFQATFACENVPQEYELPGGAGEWLVRSDQLTFPVDWHLRGTTEAAATVLERVRKKLRAIASQADEYEGDTASLPPSLTDAYRSLKAQEAEVSASGQAQHIWSCTLTVAADSAAELERRAGALLERFSGDDYELVRRLGWQRDLLLAQLPCARYRPGEVLWRYRQHTSPLGVVGSGMFCGRPEGDPAGLMLAVDLTSGLRPPLFWQPGYAASINRSPSIILAGDLGSGKSKLGKRLVVEALLPAGGRFVGIDATRSQTMPDGSRQGEWVALAELCGLPAEVIDVLEGDVAVDPLLMGLRDAVPLLVDALTVACGYDSDSREADLIARAVTQLAGGHGGRCADIPTVLRSYDAQGDPTAGYVNDRLGQVAVYLPGLFDRNRRPPRLDARYLVFATWGLTLPSDVELSNHEMTRRIPRRKRCGQATLLLVTALAKHVGWTNPNEPCLIGIEEAWRIAASPFGAELLNEITVEGRRYNTGLLQMIQDVGRLTSESRSFAGQTFGFRCGGQAADHLAAHLQVDPTVIAQLSEHVNEAGEPLSGVCLWRTVRGQLNLCRILRPPDPALDAATETTPGTVDSEAAA